MALNYDDIITDHEERLEELDESKYSSAGGVLTGNIYLNRDNDYEGIYARDDDGDHGLMVHRKSLYQLLLGNNSFIREIYIGNSASRVVVQGNLEATTTGNALPITTETITIDSASINSGSYKAFSKSVAKTGFVPLGIIGVQVTGSNSVNANLFRFYLDGATAYAYVKNNHSASVSWGVTMTILYQKSEAATTDEG